jgi:hypothetical protein
MVPGGIQITQAPLNVPYGSVSMAEETSPVVVSIVMEAEKFPVMAGLNA